MSSGHNPASLNQGSSACVIVAAARSVLKRDLRGEQLNRSCVTATIIVVLVIMIAVLTRCVIVKLLLPARAKSWEWPLPLRQPSQGCPRCTWAVVPGQPALVKKKGKQSCMSFTFLHLLWCYTVVCTVWFSYPGLQGLSTPETSACLHDVRMCLRGIRPFTLLLYLSAVEN